MDYPIRPIVPEEFDDFGRSDAASFGFDYHPDQMGDAKAVLELDRTLAAYDGDEIVSTGAIFTFDVTVPGGSLPTAGVTWISVKPTHRRRGVLRAMMARQLSDIRDKGEPLAALWAAESIIYGRFGYGLAAQCVGLQIERAHAALAVEPEVRGRFRIVDRETALRDWPAVYARILPRYPGMFSRSKVWWQHETFPERAFPRSSAAKFFVQYEEDGEVRGYSHYSVKGGDSHVGLPNGSLRVNELMATDRASYTALWSYLFGVDLMATLDAGRRQIDEPIYWMLADPRRLVQTSMDSLWVRIVDVVAALEGRRYSSPGRIVFDVKDDFCPWVAGRYRLESGENGARCTVTDDEADITLTAADLGAIYLGGTRLRTLARAGRVEGDEDALAQADAMFAWDPLPWCPAVF